MNLKSLLDGIISINYPLNYTCDICGIEIFDGTNLCEKCRGTITYNNQKTCKICGRKTSSDSICFECKSLAPKFKRAVSPLVYKDGAVKLIHKFKEGSAYLKESFADLIAPKCKVFADADCISYVPMTKRAEYDRGFNQTKLIAEALSKRLNLPLISDAIIKTKETAEQKDLGRREREKNLYGCFKANKKLVSGKNIIIVDDVMTTGATADEVTTSLLKAGVKTVYFAAVASVEYKKIL